MTGDGHHDDVLAGLTHHGRLARRCGVHVDVLKVQHHGSENNIDRNFAKRVTADHYVFCANGEHENPDLRVLEVLLKSRLGTAAERSPKPEAGQPFSVWLNCSSEYLKKQIAARRTMGRRCQGAGEGARAFRQDRKMPCRGEGEQRRQAHGAFLELRPFGVADLREKGSKLNVHKSPGVGLRLSPSRPAGGKLIVKFMSFEPVLMVQAPIGNIKLSILSAARF